MNDSKLRRFRDGASGAATLINAGCKISGDFAASGDVQVHGEVNGECDVEGTVTLAEDGVWNGTICADNVVVAGCIEGDIRARGRVEIGKSARINGTVSGDAIAVAAGAVVEGVMTTSGQEKPLEFVEKRSG